MLTIERRPLESLKVNPRNARLHDARNLEAIKSSLLQFGQAEPLILQKSSQQLIGGNGRREAMLQLGWNEADVVELDINDASAAALGVALNRTSELASWDTTILEDLLVQIEKDGLRDAVSFSDADFKELIAQLEDTKKPREVEDPGESEPPVTPVSKTGDLWLLGDHRLLCGDSTNLADVRRVMDGKLANLVATDSPYLVDYTGERPNNSGKDWTAVYKEVEITDADKFFRSTCSNMLEVMAPHAAIYFWHAHKRCGLIQQIWAELGILDHQQIIWVKPSPVFGRVFWHFRHEPCMMGWRKGSQPEHDGDQTINSVWEVDWNGKARVQTSHPTSKPTELFQRPMRKHTKPGDICYEPFSGSFSQGIAAEIERRKCYAIEISPPFVDVAIKRWEQATNQKATLDGDGRTFNEIATERLA